MSPLLRTVLGGAAALLAAASEALPEGDGAESAGTYRFDVFYDERRIGSHEFRVRDRDQGLTVESIADFEVRVMFVPVYRYHHEARELWRDGCLVELESTTRDNGERYAVQVTVDNDRVRLNRSKPSELRAEAKAPCAATYAYWDLDRLRKDRLINAQTGELESVELQPAGTGELDGEPVQRYLLESEAGGDIHLSYRQRDGRWVGLDMQRDGGTLRYRSTSI